MLRFLPAIFAITLAAAAPASAVPSLDPLKLCYVTVETSDGVYSAEPVQVGGYGFSPGAIVQVKVDEEVRVSGLAVNSDGTLPELLTESPFAPEAERKFSLTATEKDNPEQTITLEALVSPLDVRVTPREARPSQQVRFRGRGFTEGRYVYAHYLRRGKLRQTVRLAETSGACGTFDVRAPQFPFGPKKGIWRVQIDQRRKLSDAGPLLNLTIDVRRRPKKR